MQPSPAEDLAARAVAAAQGGGPADGSAFALAALDPAAAAAWLVQHQAQATETLPNRSLLRMLGLLAEAVGKSPGRIPREHLVAVLRQYGHLPPADDVTALVAAARIGEADAQLRDVLAALLARAPDSPGLLRPAAELAVAAGDHRHAHTLLTHLGRCEPTLATAQYVYRVRSGLDGTGKPPVRIALASSFTIDQLVPFVDLECRTLDLDPVFYVAPFNTWDRELLSEQTGLGRFGPEIVFLSVSADDLVPALLGAPAPNQLEAYGQTAVERMLAAVDRFVAWSPAVVVVHSLLSAFADPLGPAAGHDAPGRTEVLAALNARLADGLRKLTRAYVLDVVDLLLRRPGGVMDNPKMRHLARMRLSDQILPEVARSYVRYVAPLKGKTRKCVVLDLDNTLWGGIVGEDGPHGIRLGDTAPGSEYREFQQYLESLTKKGILLAVNSKNNEADALEVIRNHEAMVLREDAFSAMRINWENKPSNMLSLAEELNIGLDSLVFVDDSEKERALMRDALPQVLTPDMPRDPARYRETLESLPQLHVLTVTETDRTRTRQYVERRQREQLRVSTHSIEEYLGSLEIVAELDTVSDRTMARVQQLFQRTNQFNLTGRRYELGLLSERAADRGWQIYTTSVRDRFGDHGLVAAALVQVDREEWLVENFVMSCRVIGYGVEDALLAHIESSAREADARRLVGEFVTTQKNAPARDFYSRNGFVRGPDAGTAQRWRRDLSGETMVAPPWISVGVANDA